MAASHSQQSIRPSIVFSICTALILVLAAAGCAERERLGDPGPPPDDPAWEIGPTTSYPAPSSPGSVIADSVTGCGFRFPEGGSGVFGIAPIRSGPPPVYAGEGFRAEYEGDQPVEILVDAGPGDRIMVSGYGLANGSFSEHDSAEGRWLAVPCVDTTASGLAFLLTLPFETEIEKAPASTRRGFREYWISKIPAGADEITRMIHLERQSAAYIDSFLSALPEPRRSALRAEARGRMHTHYQYDGLYYQGFWWRSFGSHGRLIRPTIHLRTTADAGNVAHETGHYITHLLVGDEVWSALEGQAPLWYTEHGIADAMGREFLLEDYAYFAEWFLTGGVKAVDLHDPYAPFRDITPLGRDFPGVEGFAAVLLAALTRTTPTMRDLVSGRPTDVPAPAMDDAEVFEIISRGATGIDRLREEVAAALGPRADLLPAIAQRSGWSYSVRGRLVNPTGDPAPGIAVSSVYHGGGRTYEGGYTSLTTDADGKFAIVGGVFPGRSHIRCVDPPDTAEFLIDLDWTFPTDRTVELGNRTVSFPPVIVSLSPASGEVGDPVEVAGRRFGASQGGGGVTFGGVAAAPTEWSDTRIVATVPPGARSGDVVVTANGVASRGVDFTVRGGRWVLERYEVRDIQGQNGTWININEFNPRNDGCSIRAGYDNPYFAEVWWGDWETLVQASWSIPPGELQPNEAFDFRLTLATEVVLDDGEAGESEKSMGYAFASCAGESPPTLHRDGDEVYRFVAEPIPTWMPDSARMLVHVAAGGYVAGTAGGGYAGSASRKWTYRFRRD